MPQNGDQYSNISRMCLQTSIDHISKVADQMTSEFVVKLDCDLD